MFGIGSTEFIVILVVALIIMGPDKLPQIARGLGKAISEFKRMSTDLQRTINVEIEKQEHQERVKKAEEEFGLNKDQEQAASTPEPTPEQGAMDKAYDSATAVNQATPFSETTPTETPAEKQPEQPTDTTAASAQSPAGADKPATESKA
jgi:sec-independent protein translocase protein TatB